MVSSSSLLRALVELLSDPRPSRSALCGLSNRLSLWAHVYLCVCAHTECEEGRDEGEKQTEQQK